ncbi:MAG TPA: hypothetical protein VLC52_12115, partial [Anaerolineae bacterium]|nr:hypothetical protein [Anaerolineae bacterium]
MAEPKRQRAISLGQAFLVLGLLVSLVLGGCGPAPTSMPTPTPEREEVSPEPTEALEPSPEPTEALEPAPADEESLTVGPAFARDAALAYLATTYGQRAPASDLAWTEENVTPTDIVGASTFEYRAGDWVVTVQFPVVLPENTTYQVTVDGGDFHWEGEVNPSGEVRELVLPRGDGQDQS